MKMIFFLYFCMTIMLIDTISCADNTAGSVVAPQTNHITVHPEAKTSFCKALKNFQTRCIKECTGPVCQPFSSFATHINVDTVTHHEIQKIAGAFKMNPDVHELAEKIQRDLMADPAIRQDIKACVLNGDSKSCQRFEKHLDAKTRQYANVKCLFNKVLKDTLIAAAFVAAAHCLDCPKAVVTPASSN